MINILIFKATYKEKENISNFMNGILRIYKKLILLILKN